MTTYAVSNPTELTVALTEAGGGDTILLAEGDYGRLSLEGRKYDSEFVIKSADPNAPATFTSLNLHRSQNVTLDGLVFDYDHEPGAFFKTSDFTVTYGANITIRNSTFDGVEEGFGLGFGLVVRWAEGFTLENSEIHHFYRGFVIRESKDVVVAGNELYGMSSDGLNFAEVQNVRIEDNYLHDFARPQDSGAHPDMIQFWTNGTSAPSKDIVIRGNQLDIGDGMWTQSIFMRNEKVDSQGGGRDFFYENILIEDNVIINGHLHGITVGETDGLTIRNNVVLHAEGGQDAGNGGIAIPSMRVKANATNVEITGNITSYIEENWGLDGWNIGGNVFLQDQNPEAPDHYTSVFVDSSLTLQDGVHHFVLSEAGQAQVGNAGPNGFGAAPKDGPQALFDYVQDPNDPNIYVFDAMATLVDAGNLPAGTEVHWSFGDGAEATGLKVEHSYADPGRHEVQLTIRLPDGTEDSAEVKVTAQTDQIIDMIPGEGFAVFEADSNKVVDIGGMTEDGLKTGDTGTVGRVWRAHVNDILGADSYSMSITLKSDTAGASGELFRIHETITANITGAGELYLYMRTEGGSKRISTQNANLNDTELHDIGISYLDRTLTITVDGVVAGQVPMGRLTGSNRDLDFGNAWGERNFFGLITEFSIDRGDRDPRTGPETKVLDDRFSTGTPTAPDNENASPDTDAAGDGDDTPADAGTADPVAEDDDPPVTDIEEPVTEDRTTGGGDGTPADAGTGDPVAEDDDPPVTDTEDGTTDGAAARPPGGSTFSLADTGVSAAIAFSDIGGIRDSDAFAISFQFRSDDAAAGELFRMHGSFIAQVADDGALRFVLFTDKGKVVQKTSGVDLMDGQWYDVAITYKDGVTQILIDDVVLSEANMTGEISKLWWHALAFGNPWGKDNHRSEISDFEALFRTNGTWHAVSLEEDTERDGALFDVDYLRSSASETARENDVVAKSRIVDAAVAENLMNGAGAGVDPVNNLPEEPVDAAPEEPVDAAPEEPVDAAPEEPVDAALEEPVDAAPKEPVDAAPEEPVDAAPKEPVDAAPKEPVDAALEEPVDAAPEEPTDEMPPELVDETAFTVAKTGVSAAIAFNDVGGIRDSDTFTIGFKFRSNDDGQGELFRMHGSFVSRVSSDGEFTFKMFTDKGKVVNTTLGAGLDDGEWHDVSITYTGSSLQIAVDGAVLAETAATGEIAKAWWHALSFGNPWGKDNHQSEIADFDVLFQRNDTWYAVSMEEDARSGGGFVGADYLNEAASNTTRSNDVVAKTSIVDNDLAKTIMANGGVFNPDFDTLIFT